MPKKTLVLIIILLVTTVILIFLALQNEKNKVGEQKPTSISPTSVPALAPFASLSFSTSTLDVSDSKSNLESIDVVINTSGKPVFGAQVELSYDPAIITDVVISNSSNSFFGANPTVLIKDIDEKQGRVSYAVALSSQAEEKSGEGSVMTLKFKVNKTTDKKTVINFLPKSSIMTLKSNSTVLQQTIPLSIILNK